MVPQGSTRRRRAALPAAAALPLLLPAAAAAPDKEVSIKLGWWNETTQQVVCDLPQINLQFSSGNCVRLSKDLDLWTQAGITPPSDILLKLDCQGQEVSYKVLMDCAGATSPFNLLCMFSGATDCGGTKVVDASSFLQGVPTSVAGECQKKCAVIPDTISGVSTGSMAGEYCINVEVVSCAAVTPAPATPPPPPAPARPTPPTGTYQAAVRISYDGATECGDEPVWVLPAFTNGACMSLLDTAASASGQESSLGTLKSLGYDLTAKITCFPEDKAVDYAMALSADCEPDPSATYPLPNGWLDFGQCVHTEVMLDPSSLGGSDWGVALRQPVFMEVDNCWEVTPAPATPTPPAAPTPAPGPAATPAPGPAPAGPSQSPSAAPSASPVKPPPPRATAVPHTPGPPHATPVPHTPAPPSQSHTPVPHTPTPVQHTPVPHTPSPEHPSSSPLAATSASPARPASGTSTPSAAPPGTSGAAPHREHEGSSGDGGGPSGLEIALFIAAIVGLLGAIAFFVRAYRQRGGGTAVRRLNVDMRSDWRNEDDADEFNLVAD
eukprot:TRINITY_DN29512_c0_g1_i1.p1 TRINITY_DN29512_c0_g1~~TRINITY_DN29512_c0_g1_i1.p1  ORF type:complete len:591 (+),score=116.85 TRINITY_DN29512_c0_g1_i1:122-1774(+)